MGKTSEMATSSFVKFLHISIPCQIPKKMSNYIKRDVSELLVPCGCVTSRTLHEFTGYASKARSCLPMLNCGM